jgi:hypothetical protein
MAAKHLRGGALLQDWRTEPRWQGRHDEHDSDLSCGTHSLFGHLLKSVTGMAIRTLATVPTTTGGGVDAHEVLTRQKGPM